MEALGTKIVICARDTLFEHVELWVEGCSAKIKVNSGSFSDPFKDVEPKKCHCQHIVSSCVL